MKLLTNWKSSTITKKITPETKIKEFRPYFPLQLRNLDNNKSQRPSQVLKTINAFQRIFLRTYVLKVKWPNIVKNEDVCRKTAATEWGIIIQKRILKWFGKVIRADESTPVTRAFNYANIPYQRPHRKPTWTWLSIIKSDFCNLNLAWDEAINTEIDLMTRNYSKWFVKLSISYLHRQCIDNVIVFYVIHNMNEC